MSSSNREERSNPEQNLSPAERAELNRLEAVAQHGLGTYLQVGTALAEIRDRHLYRDSHPSFETYVRERWPVTAANGELPSRTTISTDAGPTPAAEPEPGAGLTGKPCEALARACEETFAALAGDERIGIEIKVAVRGQDDPGTPASQRQAGDTGHELLPTLRWLLTQATGTLGLVAHELENRAADVDDDAREQLRDDVLYLDEELATVKALLAELVDWDSEFGRLLEDELPPFETDPEPDVGD